MNKSEYNRDELLYYMENHLISQDLRTPPKKRVADAVESFMSIFKYSNEDARDIYEILIGNYYDDYTWDNVREFVLNYMTTYDAVNEKYPDKRIYIS